MVEVRARLAVQTLIKVSRRTLKHKNGYNFADAVFYSFLLNDICVFLSEFYFIVSLGSNSRMSALAHAMTWGQSNDNKSLPGPMMTSMNK